MDSMKRKDRQSYKGSYTVEAALLMAIIVTVMAALMIMTFYLHDRAVLQASSCEIASAGCNMATEKEQSRITESRKKMITKSRLLGSRNVSGQVNAADKQVKAGWNGNYPVPGMVQKFISKNTLPVRVSWESKKVQPADTIRKFRGIRKLVSGGDN